MYVIIVFPITLLILMSSDFPSFESAFSEREKKNVGSLTVYFGCPLAHIHARTHTNLQTDCCYDLIPLAICISGKRTYNMEFSSSNNVVNSPFEVTRLLIFVSFFFLVCFWRGGGTSITLRPTKLIHSLWDCFTNHQC